MASIRIRTGAGGAEVSRCSIPAGRKSRSAALSSCRCCWRKRRRLSATRRWSASDSSDSSDSGSRSEPVGAFVTAIGSGTVAFGVGWRFVRPRSVAPIAGSDEINRSTTAAWSPADAAGLPASQINGAPTNTPAQTAATNPRVIRDIPFNVRSRTPTGLVSQPGLASPSADLPRRVTPKGCWLSAGGPRRPSPPHRPRPLP